MLSLLVKMLRLAVTSMLSLRSIRDWQ